MATEIPDEAIHDSVQLMYRRLLGRPADKNGLLHFAAMLETGASREDVARAIVSSQEFASMGGLAGLARRLEANAASAAPGQEDCAEEHPLKRWPDLYTPRNAPFFSHRDLFRPAMLIVETVNICNNDCIICAYSSQSRARRFLPQSLFEKMLADYAAIGGGALSLTPVVGELFLDKLLLDRLAAIRATPAITKLSATTNATMARRYTDEQLEAIMSAFDRLHVSIYGLDAQEFRSMTRRDDYLTMLEQLGRLIRLSKPGVVVLGLRHLQKRHPAEVESWLAELARSAEVDRVEVASQTIEYANWSIFDTSAPLPQDATWRPLKKNDSQCMIPLVALQAMSDGTVSFCPCANFDENDDLMLGDIAQQTFAQMLASEKARRLWNWDRFGTPAFCQTCSFHVSMDTARETPWLLRDPTRFVGG